MDKQRFADGFTLVEMLVVLLLLSLCMMIFPLTQIHKSAVLQMQMETMRRELLSLQVKAIHEKRRIEIEFIGEMMKCEERNINLHMRCQGRLSFNASGNVNHAMSIPCQLDGESAKLVIQLGSGRMYVK